MMKICFQPQCLPICLLSVAASLAEVVMSGTFGHVCLPFWFSVLYSIHPALGGGVIAAFHWLPLWVLLYIFVSLGGFDVRFRLIFPCPLSQSASFAFVSRSGWWCQCLQSFSPFCLDGHVSPFLLVGWNWCSHPFVYPNIFLIVWILDGWLVLLPSACLFVCLLLDDMNYLF